jgi:putative tryptophan/tyrosine transport system substrate-binding protein
MEVTRRTAIASWLAGAAGLCRLAQANSIARLMVVTASAGGPHAVAVDGIERELAERSIRAATFRLPGEDSAFRDELKNSSSQLAIAVGIDALRTFASRKAPIPIVNTMSFRADLKVSGILEALGVRLAGALWLDLGMAQIVAGLRNVFPDASRIAVLRNPSQAEPADGFARAHPLPSGVNVKAVDCASPSDLLPAFRKLRGQADVVVCLPDSSLYNKTTVEPLILASLEHRLPLVGFSASFVRAGAAVGVYPDFADIGRQTAVLAQRCLSGPAGLHEDYPRRTVVAANERVLHLLGHDYRGAERGDVVVMR